MSDIEKIKKKKDTRFRQADVFFSVGHTIISIVTKDAVPPTAFEIGSAKNTPFVPKFPIIGSRIVSGTTITIFRNREKKIAGLGRLSA